MVCCSLDPPGRKVTAGARAPFTRWCENLAFARWLAFWHRKFRRYRLITLTSRPAAGHAAFYPFAVQRRLYLRSPGAGKATITRFEAESRSLACFIIEVRPAAYLAGAIQHGWPASSLRWVFASFPASD